MAISVRADVDWRWMLARGISCHKAGTAGAKLGAERRWEVSDDLQARSAYADLIDSIGPQRITPSSPARVAAEVKSTIRQVEAVITFGQHLDRQAKGGDRCT
jgi:hypothetical protein